MVLIFHLDDGLAGGALADVVESAFAVEDLNGKAFGRGVGSVGQVGCLGWRLRERRGEREGRVNEEERDEAKGQSMPGHSRDGMSGIHVHSGFTVTKSVRSCSSEFPKRTALITPSNSTEGWSCEVRWIDWNAAVQGPRRIREELTNVFILFCATKDTPAKAAGQEENTGGQGKVIFLV